MSSTNFSTGTIIQSSWLNDVNTSVYNTVPALSAKIGKNNFTQPAVGCTWSLADGKTLTVSNTLTFNGTDGSALTVTGASAISGTNTGDQMAFGTVAVSGQPNVVADSGSDTLTLTAGTGITLTTDATTDTVTIATNALSTPVMVLLASYTVSTAVANVDFLSVFNSTYDKYIIDVAGVAPVAASSLLMLRVSSTSSAGAPVVTGYVNRSVAGGPEETLVPSDTSFTVGNSAAAQFDMHATITISSTNSGTGSVARPILATGAGVYSVDNTRRFGIFKNGSVDASTLTGFRLYWNNATNFNRGTVRVYGIKSS